VLHEIQKNSAARPTKSTIVSTFQLKFHNFLVRSHKSSKHWSVCPILACCKKQFITQDAWSVGKISKGKFLGCFPREARENSWDIFLTTTTLHHPLKKTSLFEHLSSSNTPNVYSCKVSRILRLTNSLVRVPGGAGEKTDFFLFCDFDFGTVLKTLILHNPERIFDLSENLGTRSLNHYNYQLEIRKLLKYEL